MVLVLGHAESWHRRRDATADAAYQLAQLLLQGHALQKIEHAGLRKANRNVENLDRAVLLKRTSIKTLV